MPAPTRRAHASSGFSLTEILVVVLIVLVLAAVAVPVFVSQRAKSDQASVASDARAVVQEVTAALTGVSTYGPTAVNSSAAPNGSLVVSSAPGGPTAQVNVSPGTSVVFRAPANYTPSVAGAGDVDLTTRPYPGSGGWAPNSGDYPGTIDHAVTRGGGPSVRVTRGPGNPGVSLVSMYAYGHAGWHTTANFLPVTPGQTITISGWVRHDRPASEYVSATLPMDFFTASAAPMYQTAWPGWVNVTGPGEWHYVSGSAIVPAGAAYMGAGARVHQTSVSVGGEQVWLTEARITASSLPAWCVQVTKGAHTAAGNARGIYPGMTCSTTGFIY